MQIGILGINHKSAELPLREKLAKVCSQLFGRDNYLHNECFSFVLLSTCNRTEIYFQSPDLTETHVYIINVLRFEIKEEFEHCIYTYFGSDCFLHLARVTAGIDSALIGETEIQGQVKRAYEEASSFHSLPPEIHFLFQKCLKIGKNIRTNTHFFQKTLSIEEAILNATKENLGDFKEQRILFVGLSNINYKIFSHFKQIGTKFITLCNRTNEKAKQVVKKENIGLLMWENLKKWIDFDLIIFGTSAPQFLIHSQALQETVSNKLIIDLSVPRNVDPKLGRHPNITLLNIDQINHSLNKKQKLKAQELAHIESQLIVQTVDQQTSLFKLREYRRTPALQQAAS